MGCANVDRKPYENFEQNISKVADSMTISLSDGTNWSREGDIESIATDPEIKASLLQVKPGLRYDWQIGRRPNYFAFKDAEDKFTSLAAVFTNYAKVLSQLAGNEIHDEKSFNQIAADLNRRGLDATKNISNSNVGIPIISSEAIQLLRTYVDAKRLDYLAKAIAENQNAVEEYSRLSIQLIQLNRESLKGVYAEKVVAALRVVKQIADKIDGFI